MYQMIEKTIKVAIYVRVSTEEQAEHGYSIDAQLDTLRNYCKMYGKEVYNEYVDRGVSGKSMNGRYELQKLLQDAKEKLFDEVIVWKINRFARKNIDLLHIVDILDKHNIAFRSFSENFETATPIGKFALQMMGAVGELERNTIVDNVKLGMKQRAKAGRHNGKLPLGYKVLYDPINPFADSSLVIVPEEALVIQKIYHLYSTGRGLKSIANELNHSGFFTKQGNAFSISAIKAILTNPMYVGRIRYNHHENWSEKRRRGRNPNPILVEGKHEAIIPEELWENVQELMNKKSSISPRTFNGEYLLTGLIRCPKCGAAMVASRTKSKQKNGEHIVRMYYSCGNFRSKGSSVCSANSIRKQEAEDYVVTRLKEVLSEEKILKSIVEKMNNKLRNRTQPLQQELKHITNQIEQIEAKKIRYLDLYENGQFEKTPFSSRLQELQTDLDKWYAEKSKLEYTIREDNAIIVSYKQVHALISHFDKLLESTSFEQRKTLLHLIVRKITLNQQRKIESIELNLDEGTEYHFSIINPSATSAEGVFCTYKKQRGTKERNAIII